MRYAVKLSMGGVVSVVEVKGNVLDECYRVIDCSMVEVVPSYLPFGYIMIADEEGALKVNDVNFVASHLCGEVIMGNAIILKHTRNEYGEDDFGFFDSKDEAAKLVNEFIPDFVRNMFER